MEYLESCTKQAEKLAGISTGGWIAISTMAGICFGIAATLAFQCYRRRRQLRYSSLQDIGRARQQPAVGAAAATMPAGIEYRPPPAMAPPNIPSVQKYFSPLSAKAAGTPVPSAGGTMLQMHHEQRSCMRISVDAGDIQGMQVYDQQMQRDVSYAGLAQSYPQLPMPQMQGPLSSQAPTTLSTTALSTTALSRGLGAISQYHLGAAGGSLQIEQGRLSQLQAAQHQQQLGSNGSAAPPPGVVQKMQLLVAEARPQPAGCSVIPAEGQSIPVPQQVLQGASALPQGLAVDEDRGVLPVSTHPGTIGSSSNSTPVQPDASAAGSSQPTSTVKGSQQLPRFMMIDFAAAAAAAQSPQSSRTSTAAPALSPPRLEQSSVLHAEQSTNSGAADASTAAIAAEFELEEEYDMEDLDGDWRQLLGDVDARLDAQSARPMNSRERSVAIKKLLAATGTRGVDFAMNDALLEVLQFRANQTQ